MADINVPHFSYPFRWGSNAHAVEVEQNSADDIIGCVVAALKTERGTRLYVPTFGIDNFAFTNMPIDLPLIEAQVRESEPRADLLTSEKITDLVDNIVIGVDVIE